MYSHGMRVKCRLVFEKRWHTACSLHGVRLEDLDLLFATALTPLACMPNYLLRSISPFALSGVFCVSPYHCQIVFMTLQHFVNANR